MLLFPRRSGDKFRNALAPPSPLTRSAAQSWGNLSNPAGAASAGRRAQTEAAAKFAASELPVIASLQKSGVTSYRGIAAALNDRSVRTVGGGRWQVSNVRNLLARLQ